MSVQVSFTSTFILYRRLWDMSLPSETSETI